MGSAQVSTYGFYNSTNTYTPISGGTVLGTTTTDDERFVDPSMPLGAAVNNASGPGFLIGFDFVFNGNTNDVFSVNANGWITLGNSTVTPNPVNNVGAGGTPLSATAASTPALLRDRISAFGIDMKAGAGGEIQYLTQGAAPNRTLTVQWTDYTVGTSTTSLNFQIVLHETSNLVEVVYGTCTTDLTGNTNSAQVGLGGDDNTDYNNRKSGSSWANTTAGTASNNKITLNSTTVPASGLTFYWAPLPNTPATITENAGTSCATGAVLTYSGSPETSDITWYWQTSATGTSTANSATTYTVTANGTYYLRAQNTASGAWSELSSSFTVSDIPVATTPPAPTAAANPACMSTTLTVPASPGIGYFWQTAADQMSTTTPVAGPLTVNTTGTYYVAAYDSTTMCWSATSSLAVTVSTYTPEPVTGNPSVTNVCSGASSAMVAVNPPSGTSSTTVSSGTIDMDIPDDLNTGITSSLNVSTIPAGATITGIAVTVDITHEFDGDLRIRLVGANGTTVTLSNQNGGSGENYTNTVFSSTATTDITDGTPPYTGTFLPEGNLSNVYAVTNGTWSLKVADLDAIFEGTLNDWSITITYTVPASTVSWYDAATGGSLLGTGTPFETVGTSVLPNTSTEGPYHFYAAAVIGGCESTRTDITVNVTTVLAELIPVDNTCNGGAEGSFTLGTINCGTGPFLYAVDGATTYGAIPANLPAGEHTVVMQDQSNMAISAPITVMIAEPTAPTALSVVGTPTLTTATVDWTPQGSETDWVIEYGPAGFTPGTGTLVPAATHPFTVTGLTAGTAYQFYVRANCVATSAFGGPKAFSTHSPYLVTDNACGPGFTDISGTGTHIASTDDSATDLTLPWSWNIGGTILNTVTVLNNGVLLFNTSTGDLYDYEGDAGLYPLVEDFDTPAAGDGIFYQSVGTAPNRQFIVEWKNMVDYSDSPSDDGATFEIIVNESDGNVYYIYDDVLTSDEFVDYGAFGEIVFANGSDEVYVSDYDTEYLTDNTCAHFSYQTCPNITSLDTTIYTDEAILDWDASLYGETQWTVIYGPEGFDPTATPSLAYDTLYPSSSDVDLTGLTQLTTYDVYIYTECQADNLLSSGYFYEFTTLPLCADPTDFTGTSYVDSLELTWSYTANAGYDVTSYQVQYGFTGFGLGSGTIAPLDGLNLADTVHDAGLLPGGVYDVYIQATCGTTSGDTSNWVLSTITMPLTNNNVCTPVMLPIGQNSYVFNNTGATVATGENAIAPPATGAQTTTGWADNTLNKTTWFTFVAPSTGSVRINSTAIEYDNQLAVYKVADCSVFSTYELQGANDNAIGGTSLASNFTLCGLIPGQTYYVMNDGATNAVGNYGIVVTEIVLDAGSANAVTNVCSGSPVDLTGTIAGNDAGGVWSSVLPSVNASISGNTLNSGGIAGGIYDLQYRVTDGCAYDSIVSQVKVFEHSNAGTDGTISVCKHQTLDLYAALEGTVDHGGTWYNSSNAPITGSYVTMGTFAGSFNYDYIVNNGVCPNDTSNVVIVVLSNCDALGLDEASLEGVNVYPNPSTGLVYISSDVAESFDIRVTDVNGRLISEVKSGVTNAAIAQVDLGKTERGVYLIHLSNSSAEKTYRVVIQ